MAHVVSDHQKSVLRRGHAAEVDRQRVLDYIKEEQSHAIYIKDKLINPTDSIKQLGRPLHSDMVERMLATVLPSSVAFIENKYKPGFRAAVRVMRRFDDRHGSFETIVPYEFGIMPEHSTYQLVEEELPDPDVLSRKKSISRKDLGKFEYKKGEGFEFEEGGRAGFIKNQKLGHTIKRGWRTVLMRLVISGFLSVADAERLFGTSNNPTWQQYTGKVNESLVPW